MMYRITKLLGAAAIAAASLAVTTPAAASVPVSLNNCSGSLALPTPDAIQCIGYYTGNVLNGSSDDVAAQQAAVAALGGSFNGNWSALASSTNPYFVLDTDPTTPNPGLTNGNQLNFGTMLSGLTIIGAHFGNIPDPFANPNNNGQTGNVSVFWLFNLTTPTDHITLDNTQGWSNAALYQTQPPPPPGVPEPATWAMMLMGFGATGFAMRRSRRKALLAQIA
jgi:PEP-CTERM motif